MSEPTNEELQEEIARLVKLDVIEGGDLFKREIAVNRMALEALDRRESSPSPAQITALVEKLHAELGDVLDEARQQIGPREIQVAYLTGIALCRQKIAALLASLRAPERTT